MNKLRQAVLCVAIFATGCVCFGDGKAFAEQTDNGKNTTIIEKKKPSKNIFGEDAKNSKKRQGWAERELRKEGYKPGEMTDSDYRKILGAD